MFCAKCSFPLEAEDLFCRRCGVTTPAGEDAKISVKRRLRRANDDRKVAGVCGGVARYLKKDPRLVRAIWTGASLLPFSPGLIAYGLCWAVMRPEKGTRPPDIPTQ